MTTSMFGMNAIVAVAITPPQYPSADMGYNLWSLRQWVDATSPISMEEPVMAPNRIAAHPTKLGCIPGPVP